MKKILIIHQIIYVNPHIVTTTVCIWGVRMHPQMGILANFSNILSTLKP
jgi:hypothetical protein